MPLELVRTTYGRPALAALRTVVATAKAGDALAPVTVVVPTNHVGVTARRMLATGRLGPICERGTGVAGVTFLTPYRLAELLGAPGLAAAGRRPVSTPVLAAAMRQALAHDAGIFRPVADHVATETALVRAFGELADLSPRALATLAARGPRAHDVVRLCRAARHILAKGWYDEADLVDAGTAAIADAPLAGELGHVVIYLPQDLTQRTAALLRAVGGARPTTVIAAFTGVERADEGVRVSLERLATRVPPADPSSLAGRADGRTDEKQPGSTTPRAGPAPAGQPAYHLPVDRPRTKVVTASDADEEVRAARRAVVDAARAGTPLERMAVLFGHHDPYARLVHEHFAAAGIPTNGVAVRPVAAHVLGRTLLDVLALGDHRLRRREVLGLLSAAPLRHGPDGAPAPTADWERLSREAAIVGGREQWDRRLAQLAEEYDRRAAALDEAGPAPDRIEEEGAARPRSSAERLRRRAARARSLRALVLGLADELAHAEAGSHAWVARVRWARRVLSGLVGGESARTSWPPGERKAAERVEAALDRLAALDGVGEPPSLEVFRRTLEIELGRDLGRVGRLGEGVLVAPLSFAIGVDLDLVIVVGMAEGTLPARLADDSLLPDRERRHTAGELPLRRARVDREHRWLLAALAGADRHVLCMPRGDLRVSNERVPSRWLVDVATTLEGRAVDSDELLSGRFDWLEQVPSFAHAVTTAEFPPTPQDYRLRMGTAPSGGEAPPDAVLTAGRAVIRARSSPSFTRFDGNLADAAVPSPTDGVVSATRLEQWASCPHAYYVHYLLRVDPIDDPEEQLTISALDRGSLVHEVLERFILGVLARPAELRPAPAVGWTADDRATLRRIAEETCDDFEARGLTGRAIYWRRDRARLLGLFDRFLTADDVRRRETRTRPIGAELPFGFDDADLPPVEVALADGRALRFRGAIDRIDVADDGTLVVTDYKTGSAGRFLRLSQENPIERGTKLQLPIYGLAARQFTGRPDAPVAAEYWFVSDRGGFARRGYQVTDDVVAATIRALGIIVTGVERGVFPAHPSATHHPLWVECVYCDPDGLGVSDRRREWERKRHDPALRIYADLVEPIDAAGDAPDDAGEATPETTGPGLGAAPQAVPKPLASGVER